MIVTDDRGETLHAWVTHLNWRASLGAESLHPLFTRDLHHGAEVDSRLSHVGSWADHLPPRLLNKACHWL